jgi:hypothetical protein
MLTAPPWTTYVNYHWSERAVGIIIAGRGGGSCYIRNRDLCRQLKLGKIRSQQLVNTNPCYCYTI